MAVLCERRLVVEPSMDGEVDTWRRVLVAGEERRFEGWWRTDGEFILVTVTDPSLDVPTPLAAGPSPTTTFDRAD